VVNTQEAALSSYKIGFLTDFFQTSHTNNERVFKLGENVCLLILLYSCGDGLGKSWFRISARNCHFCRYCDFSPCFQSKVVLKWPTSFPVSSTSFPIAPKGQFGITTQCISTPWTSKFLERQLQIFVTKHDRITNCTRQYNCLELGNGYFAEADTTISIRA
jgi:hypothetical protein